MLAPGAPSLRTGRDDTDPRSVLQGLAAEAARSMRTLLDELEADATSSPLLRAEAAGLLAHCNEAQQQPALAEAAWLRGVAAAAEQVPGLTEPLGAWQLALVLRLAVLRDHQLLQLAAAEACYRWALRAVQAPGRSCASPPVATALLLSIAHVVQTRLKFALMAETDATVADVDELPRALSGHPADPACEPGLALPAASLRAVAGGDAAAAASIRNEVTSMYWRAIGLQISGLEAAAAGVAARLRVRLAASHIALSRFFGAQTGCHDAPGGPTAPSWQLEPPQGRAPPPGAPDPHPVKALQAAQRALSALGVQVERLDAGDAAACVDQDDDELDLRLTVTAAALFCYADAASALADQSAPDAPAGRELRVRAVRALRAGLEAGRRTRGLPDAHARDRIEQLRKLTLREGLKLAAGAAPPADAGGGAAE